MKQEELKLEYHEELDWLWSLIDKTMAEADQNMMVNVS